MKKVLVMFTALLFLATTVLATGPIMKVHKDNPKGKRADGKPWNCAQCHGDKQKDPKTWPVGVVPAKKADLKGYKKGEAKHGELKNNPLCKDCHK